MFQRIVVPLDGSHRAERAVPVAARIARSTGGSIVLMQAVFTSTMGGTRMTQHVIDTDIANATDYLTVVSRSDELRGIETKTEVLPGEPALTIFAVARSHHADLIVICSHGETGLKRWILGSISQKVTRQSALPVLVLCEDTNFSLPEGSPLRVLVPLDGSLLAEAALAPAEALSTAVSAPIPGALHLLHVLPKPLLEDEMQNKMIASERTQAVSEAKTYLKMVEQQLRVGEREHVKNLNVTITSSVVTDMDIASTLIRVAENGEAKGEGEDFQGGDMIVMATHGRGGLGRWIMGSVTERVLGATKLPLLIVRPHKSEAQQEERKETEMQSWVGLL